MTSAGKIEREIERKKGGENRGKRKEGKQQNNKDRRERRNEKCSAFVGAFSCEGVSFLLAAGEFTS